MPSIPDEPQNRLCHINLAIVWDCNAPSIGAAVEADNVTAEIARDMEGTIRSAFKDWIERHGAVVKTIVVAMPVRD